VLQVLSHGVERGVLGFELLDPGGHLLQLLWLACRRGTPLPCLFDVVQERVFLLLELVDLCQHLILFPSIGFAAF